MFSDDEMLNLDNSKLIKPMKGSEIYKWLPNAKIIRQADLRNMKQLPKLPLVLLYEIKKDFGHWVTVLETPEGIEHFDSYGYAPDSELSFIPDNYKIESHQNEKHLLKLLLKKNEQINYSNFVFQDEPPIATCGRWVILRNLLNYLTIDQFHKSINRTSKELGVTPDQLVTFIV